MGSEVKPTTFWTLSSVQRLATVISLFSTIVLLYTYFTVVKNDGTSKFLLTMTTFSRPPLVRSFPTTPLASKGNNLMLLSYMRSGSSMNGEVFRDDDNDFYIFEPLIRYAPFQYLTEDRVCEMGSLKCSIWANATAGIRAEEVIEETVDTIKNIYGCNFHDMDEVILRNIMFENKMGRSKSSQSWFEFTTCYLKLTEPEESNIDRYFKNSKLTNSKEHENVLKLLNETESKSSVFRDCIHKLESKCNNSEIRVTKVLRLSLRFVPRLMAQFSDLKFMFIMRDPRGNLNSRLNTGWFPVDGSKPEEVKRHISSLCFQMAEDIKMVTYLKREFPGRLVDIRLEDIVRNPLQSYNDLFNILDLNLSESHKRKISELFEARPNFETSWKSTLPEQYCKMIENDCESVLNFYNYPKMFS